MFCVNCGNVIDENDKYCSVCGARTDSDNPVEIINNPDIISAPLTDTLPEILPDYNKNNQKSERQYFGLTSLILCLVIIGILSILCGILGGVVFQVSKGELILTLLNNFPGKILW